MNWPLATLTLLCLKQRTILKLTCNLTTPRSPMKGGKGIDNPGILMHIGCAGVAEGWAVRCAAGAAEQDGLPVAVRF